MRRGTRYRSHTQRNLSTAARTRCCCTLTRCRSPDRSNNREVDRSPTTVPQHTRTRQNLDPTCATTRLPQQSVPLQQSVHRRGNCSTSAVTPQRRIPSRTVHCLLFYLATTPDGATTADGATIPDGATTPDGLTGARQSYAEDRSEMT
jgi:hypothetical protein